MDEIPNKRVLSFVERAMEWPFEIVYVKGEKIPAPDATSRHPNPSGAEVCGISKEEYDGIDVLGPLRMELEDDGAETAIIAAARSSTTTW